MAQFTVRHSRQVRINADFFCLDFVIRPIWLQFGALMCSGVYVFVAHVSVCVHMCVKP